VQRTIHLRIFSCKRGRGHVASIARTLQNLDSPVEVDDRPGKQTPAAQTKIAIGIWAGTCTSNDIDFYRELSDWEQRGDTEVHLYRAEGEAVTPMPDGLLKTIHNFDVSRSLHDWLVQDVLELQENTSESAQIQSRTEALRFYCAEFQRSLRDNRLVSGLGSNSTKPLIDTYLPLTLFDKSENEFVADRKILPSLLSVTGCRIFVTGVPGSGKSTLLNLLSFYLTEEDSNLSALFPIFLRAKDIADAGYSDIIELIRVRIKATVNAHGKDVVDFLLGDEDFPAESAVLLVDGLDELDETQRIEVRSQINTFEIRFPKMRIVITSRPNAYDKKRWSEYTLLRIRPLTQSEALTYVAQHGLPDTASALADLIKNSEQVRELSAVPFMLALMANYAGSTTNFPKHRAQLIDRCILGLIERRRVRPSDIYDEDQLIQCLSSVSFRLFKIDPTGKHSEREFMFAIQDFISQNPLNSSTDRLERSRNLEDSGITILDEIIRGTGLLQRNGGYIEFVHRTVWEYFVAHFIVHSVRSEVTEFSFLPIWEEPIRIAAGLLPGHQAGEFIRPVWSKNSGLAIRALSECPEDVSAFLRKGLESLPHEGVCEIAREIRESLFLSQDTAGERVALDTLNVLLPLTKSAEVCWEALQALKLIKLRRREAAELIARTLDLQNAPSRLEKLKEEIAFVAVPSGQFEMGNDRDNSTIDQQPAHPVKVSKFEIATITLRNKDVDKCPIDIGESDKTRSPTKNHPIIRVTWFEAFIVAAWFGCRLPTEAEWEYACRCGGADDSELFTEDGITKQAWHSANSDNVTHVGAQKEPNSWGLYDMIGNVREWCSDWFSEALYYERGGDDVSDPCGPESGTKRVLRGGCFDYNIANLPPTYRHGHAPEMRGFQNGVRFVAGLPAEITSLVEQEAPIKNELEN